MAVTGVVQNGRAKLTGMATEPMEMTVRYDLLADGSSLSGETSSTFGTFGLTGSKRD